MAFSAVLDACVLVPSVLRDVLLELGVMSVYRPVWSGRIEEEMEKAILRIHARHGKDEEASRSYVLRMRKQMNQALPDARVRDWEGLLPAVPRMRDPNDRHVVAAALSGRADVIVTFNLKDFEEGMLPGYLFSQSPDGFLLDLLDLHPDLVMAALRAVSSRSGRKGPKWTVQEVLDRLEHEGLKGLAAACRPDVVG